MANQPAGRLAGRVALITRDGRPDRVTDPWGSLIEVLDRPETAA